MEVFMDNNVLKKRINTFKSAKGVIKNMSNEVIIDVLRAWEQWSGTAADLYRDLGIKKGQMSSIIKRAKKLVNSGIVAESEFKEVEIEEPSATPTTRCGIELVWDNNKVIRFGSSDLLMDFLKKAA